MELDQGEPIKITLKLKTREVEIEDLEGNTAKYTLKEMNGTARDAHMTAMAARVKMDASGKPVGLKTFDALQASLITKCLYDEEGKPVSLATIQNWPASAQTALFKAAQKINAMDEEVKEEIKNA